MANKPLNNMYWNWLTEELRYLSEVQFVSAASTLHLEMCDCNGALKKAQIIVNQSKSKIEPELVNEPVGPSGGFF